MDGFSTDKGDPDGSKRIGRCIDIAFTVPDDLTDRSAYRPDMNGRANIQCSPRSIKLNEDASSVALAEMTPGLQNGPDQCV